MDGKKLDLNAPLKAHFHSLTPKDWREQALEDHLKCPMCGSDLLMVHVTQFVHLEVDEEAHCESCKVRIRKSLHRLQ